MKKLFAFTIALTAIFAVSCQKEKELHPVGSKIVFTAATEYKNGVETRTIYSGDYTNTTPNYERIQWISTDDVEILYSHGSNSSAKYDIDGTSIQGSSTQRKSTADITLKSGSSALEWADGNTHKFFGVYPASSNSNGLTLTTTGSGNNLNGRVNGLVIPDHQTATYNSTKGKYLPDMSKAYMVSFADYSQNPETTVALPFTPVMSAFEFNLKLPDNKPSYTVSKVQLSAGSTNIAGGYSVNITGYDSNSQAVTWTYTAQSSPTPKTSVVVSFNNNGATEPAIPNSNAADGLHFTLFTLPVSISNPVLSIKYHDGTVKQVTLTGLTLAPGQKVVVSNNKAGHDDFTYEVSGPANQTITGHTAASFSQINISSIKRSEANSSYTEPVAWKVQYTTDNGSTWTDGVPSTYTLTETHSNSTNNFTVSLNGANSATEDFANKKMYTAATELLRAREPASGTIDLSYYNVAGEALASRTTANCYVITRPGTYRIPLIYGNAIVQGQTNSYAYNPASLCAASGSVDPDDQNYFLPTFLNGAGDVIDSPYILTDLGTLSGNNYSITNLSALISPLSQQACISTGDLTIVTDSGESFIQFTVSQQTIKPGNIIIHLKGTVGSFFHSTQSLWSWHIWITDKDVRPSSGVMPYNLGWIDDDVAATGGVLKYTDRNLRLRIVQVEGGTIVNEGTPFTLSQTGDLASVPGHPDHGTNTQYQWGRKDPYPTSASSIQLTQWAESYDRTLGIKNPEVMIQSEKSKTWLNGVAVPLYRITQTPTGDYTLPAGTYGPFTNSQKTSIQVILGNSGWSTKKRVNSHSGTERWFTSDVYGWMITGPSAIIPEPVPAENWFQQGVVYAMNPGTILSSTQLTTLSNLCTNVGTVSWPSIGITANDYNAFVNSCLDDVYYITLNSARTVSSSQKTTLEGQGFSSTVFTTNYSSTESFTTDAERNAGSILYNLWSASLYNEYATVSGGKYKTVYDPCPAGFTVPTFGTYLNASPSTLNNKRQDGISGFSGYPRSGYRDNVDQNITNAQNNVHTSMSLVSTKGLYWTDHPCNLKWNGSGAKDNINSYLYYTDAYMLQTDASSASLQAHARCDAASIRPIVDPRASSVAGNATPAQVSATNPIESVTMGSEL